jgi:hypothetical protein
MRDPEDVDSSRAGASVRWRLRRLAAMSGDEVVARVVREARHRADDLEWQAARRYWRRRWEPRRLDSEHAIRPIGFLTRDRGKALAAEDPDGASTILRRADAVLAGEVSLLGYPAVNLPLRGRDYSFDAVAGYRWPEVHGKKVNYRNAPADPKWIWELNRCQELPVLAQAWLVSGDRRYAEEAAAAFLAWIAQHQPGRGVAWTSGFEAGIRALSLATTYDALAASPELDGRLRGPALRALWQHGRWICRDPSTHSSANNHRIGELVGLLAVGVLAPELPEAGSWVGVACEELAAEVERQILPDGTSAEQSFSYGLFVIDLVLVAVALLDTGERDVPQELIRALERAGDALWAQLGCAGEPEPTYGDDDDGRALRLDGADVRTAHEVASSICARAGHSKARSLSKSVDPAAWWMFGRPGKERFQATTAAPPPGSELLDAAGRAILRQGSTRVQFDAGTLGYLSLAAHGHADALSVSVSLGDAELVVDPGTGSYFRRHEVRGAFRGTGFHATAQVDTSDQSSPGGPFLWWRHARSRFTEIRLEDGVAAGEHDGYEALADPVRHRRAVIALEEDRIVVYDRLDASESHAVSLHWPLHPELVADICGPGELRAERADGVGLELVVAASTDGSISVARGEESPFAGWWSPRLEQVVPAPLVRWETIFRNRLDVATILCPRRAPHRPLLDLTLRRQGPAAEIALSTTAGRRAVTLDFDAVPPAIHLLSPDRSSRSGAER